MSGCVLIHCEAHLVSEVAAAVIVVANTELMRLIVKTTVAVTCGKGCVHQWVNARTFSPMLLSTSIAFRPALGHVLF